jgi:hypothetical protein
MYFSRTSFAVLLWGAIAATAAHAESDKSIALVLDASGSMKARLADGKTRMEAAKTAVSDFVGKLGPDTRLAFWAYGHQSATSKKDCKDNALLSDFDAVSVNKATVVDKARSLEPLGYTPITYSISRAAEGLGSEEATSRVVVLVSDGKETCQADPCAAAKALADADAKLVVHTVGVGVDSVTRAQLQCIATAARGNYYDANSASELSSALGKAADAAPVKKKQITITTPKLGKLKMKIAGHFSHEVMDAGGKAVANLNASSGEVQVPAGIYSVKFGNGLWSSIEVKSGETTEIKPGYLEVKPTGGQFVYILDPETGEPVDDILYTKPRATLIPGHFDVKFGEVLWPNGVDVKPGEVAVLQPGVIKIQTNHVMYFDLLDANGQKVARGDSPGATRHALPPGKYTLHLDADKWVKTLTDEQRKMEVELEAGQELEVAVE